MLSSLVGRPEVDALVARADAALGEPLLSRVIAEGPAEELALTTWTQPAMLLAGIANLAAWRAEGGPEPDFVAGHSLGEYTALVAAGSLDLDTAVKLVRLRAQAMQEAVPVGTGGMAAILGLSDADVQAACDEARAVPGSDQHEEVAPVNSTHRPRWSLPVTSEPSSAPARQRRPRGHVVPSCCRSRRRSIRCCSSRPARCCSAPWPTST